MVTLFLVPSLIKTTCILKNRLEYKFKMHTKRLKLDKFYVKISYLNLFNLLRANSTRVSKNPLKFSIYDTKNP